MDDWNRYHKWNEAIERVVFSGRFSGQPVYLDPEDELIEEICAEAGEKTASPQDTLRQVVLPTLVIDPDGGHVFDIHFWKLLSWLKGGSHDTPPCLCVLMFLAAVAEGMKRDQQFRANNYLGRLVIALEGEDLKARRRIERDFRKQTPPLWQTLNTWLDDSEGLRGFPTAYAFDWRKYVSVPISQALVRAEDRNRLRTVFGSYGLQSGQLLPVSEMMQLLREWIPASNVTRALKRLWQQGAAQERIAEIACVELEAWDGITHEDDNDELAVAPLLLVAEFRSRPRISLSLDLMVRSARSIPRSRYTYRSGSGDSTSVSLEDSTLESWLELRPNDVVSVADALISNVDLVGEGARGFALRRRCRRLVPLRYNAEERLYVESRRVELLTPCMILCHESFAEKLTSYLDLVARPGFRVFSPDQVASVPANWVLFHRVQITSPGEESHDEDLEPLQPVSQAQVAFGGGFSIPGRSTWHSDRPPEISMAAIDDGIYQARLDTLHGLTPASQEPSPLDLERFEQTFLLDLSALDLPDGDYRITLNRIDSKDKAKRVMSASFRLRSGRTARPIRDHKFRHWIDDEELLWPLTASSRDEGDAVSGFVTGAAIGDLAPEENADLSGAMIPLTPPTHADRGPEDEAPEQRVYRSSVTAPDCLNSGCHHWILEPATRGRRRFRRLRGRCRHCGLERWHGGRRGKQKDGPDQQRPVQRRASRLPEIRASESTSLDLLLDALSYARHGSWASFARMADEIDDSPWFASEMARLLSGLGHVDLSFDPATGQISGWEIAPAAFCQIGAHKALLCGFRSQTLLERLEDDATALGGTVSKEELPGSPLRVVVSGLSMDDLDVLSRSMEERHTLGISVSRDTARRLAHALPPLRSLARVLPDRSWLRTETEFYELQTGAWESNSDPVYAGAYRFRTRPITYAFVSARDLFERRLRVTDVRTAKHLAAAEAGRPLIGYDPVDGRLQMPLGAQLPGLFERAAVLCSGVPPGKTRDRLVEYSGVPEEVARLIWSRLSGAKKPQGEPSGSA